VDPPGARAGREWLSREDEPGVSDSPIVARTRHGDITLEDMAGMLPGLGALMPLIADRYVVMHFAAKGGNWGLANYEYLQMAHLFRTGMKTRPKQAHRLSVYLAEFGEALRAAIKARDLSLFERASDAAVAEANRIHRELAVPYIVFRIPDAAPGHLDLTAQHHGDVDDED
jgi:hypothetical protein